MRASEAADTLRRAASAGRLRPGERLPEERAAAHLGVSRNTLREAFAALVADGILVREPHRGVVVAAPGAADVAEIYTARLVIEPAALRLGGGLDAGQLEALVARAEALRDNGELDAVADANQEFHRMLVAAAGSRHLDREMGRLLALMRLGFLRIAAAVPGFHARFVADNRAVADLVAAGDRSGAAALLESQLARTRELLAGRADGERASTPA